ncbi:hypothetical protein ACFW6N_32095 [Streptomyces cyaneofuscatus]|uniref:hypothetical protein n=1 Tax=Streptomyces cyaneofuscatus TaxID=66883 RepID=UPI0036B6FA5D
MSTTEEQAAAAFQSASPIVLAPGPRTTDRVPPLPSDVWDLPHGTAWVYHGEGNSGLTTRSCWQTGSAPARATSASPGSSWSTVRSRS